MSHFRQPFLPPEALSDERTIAAAAAHAVGLARAGHARRGLALALQARHQAHGLESEAGELAALNAAAICHGIRGDHASAAAAGIDAFELAQRLGNERVRDDALITLCNAACSLGLKSEARALLPRLVRTAAAADPELELRARVAFGLVLGELAEFDCAERQFTHALGLIRLHGCASPARIGANLANLHRKRAEHGFANGATAEARAACALAQEGAQRALADAIGEANALVEVDALAILAHVHMLLDDATQAHACFERAATRAKAARARGSLAWILVELGLVRLGLGAIDAARDALQEALEAAIEYQPSARVAQACRALGACDHAQGDQLGERRWQERAAAEDADFERARAHTRRDLHAFFLRASASAENAGVPQCDPA